VALGGKHRRPLSRPQSNREEKGERGRLVKAAGPGGGDPKLLQAPQTGRVRVPDSG